MIIIVDCVRGASPGFANCASLWQALRYCGKGKELLKTDITYLKVSLGGAVVKNPPANTGDTRTQMQSLSRKDPLEKEMATTPVFLPGKSHGQRSLAGYSPWRCKSWNDLVTKPSPHIGYLTTLTSEGSDQNWMRYEKQSKISCSCNKADWAYLNPPTGYT